MERRFGSTRLAPAGLVVEHAAIDTDCIFLDVRAAAVSATCPCCGTNSCRIQSRYMRQAADLPIGGRRVVLRVMVRRFWCDAVLCRRRIFAERFGDNVLAPLSRRTGRLETIVHHLGLALGGRPAAAFADRLMMPVSNDTLLRVVRRMTEQPRDELAIVGIDDFAFRRGQRYGTIGCDLERRRPVTLLPDREQATSQAWLSDHPSITTVARDLMWWTASAPGIAMCQSVAVESHTAPPGRSISCRRRHQRLVAIPGNSFRTRKLRNQTIPLAKRSSSILPVEIFCDL
jgi:hypothetical protein